jgi:FKBP-type peptidyl-prolyl cis-trans isomerase FklB
MNRKLAVVIGASGLLMTTTIYAATATTTAQPSAAATAANVQVAAPQATTSAANNAPSASAQTATSPAAPPADLDPNSGAATLSDLDKLSYSIGTDLGKNIKRQGIDINPDMLSQGLHDSLADKPLLISDKDTVDILAKFQKDLMQKHTQEFSNMSKENKEKGESFLTQNKLKSGVIVLASGLQYKIITPGKGPKPTKDDTVTVDYTGKLINGNVFDSTDKTGKPASFKVSQVIPGWTEALQLMPTGSVWEVYIPSNLAYGERSVGGVIGPNETLVFTVHLISIDKPKT